MPDLPSNEPSGDADMSARLPTPIAFSAAGFKALPFESPPTLPLQGLVVLMGTNSAGKSSLLLALRLASSSLLYEPRLERLHLRAPGLPVERLADWASIQHRRDTPGEETRDVERPMAFRFVFDGGRMLELRFAQDHPERLPENDVATEATRLTRNQGERAHHHPIVIPQIHGKGIRAFLHPDHTDDPWAEGWKACQPGEAAQLVDSLVQSLQQWAEATAFLDPIRDEQVPLNESPKIEQLHSASVSPRGENAAGLMALTYDGCHGPVGWDPAEGDTRPSDGSQWFTPLSPTLPIPTAGVDPTYFLSRLLLCCGLEPVHINSAAPGQPVHLRAGRQWDELFNLGDGQRQALPVLVQALFSNSGTTLCWEHPDLHLHPGAATGLGRIAYRLAATGRNVLIETHSRDLIEGVHVEAARVRIEAVRHPDSPLHAASAVLAYLYASEGRLHSERHRLDESTLDLPLWPGFVDDDVRERHEFEASMGLSVTSGPLDASWLRTMLAKGEGDQLEWKAALSWNLETQKSTREMARHVMRSIAALCNTNGGYLFIGIDKVGRAVGWDTNLPEYDRFEQHLINVVRDAFGAAFYREHIACKSVRIDERNVAVVSCDRANEPILLHNPKRQEAEFLVRCGGTSQPLRGAEAARWIDIRFGRRPGHSAGQPEQRG